VKKKRSDNGPEFKNLQVKEYLQEKGIKHEFSAPYTPQQNGVVEKEE
jgi:transposase InsO family protein